MVLKTYQCTDFTGWLGIWVYNLSNANGAVSRLNEGSFWAMELAAMLVELLFRDICFLVSHGSQFEDDFLVGCHFIHGRQYCRKAGQVF